MKKCKHCGDTLPKNQRGLVCNVCRNGIFRYGLNKNDMISLYESQNKRCKLCDKEVKLFSRREADSGYIDHNHTTGKVRSILCHPCNTSLGYIENKLDIEKLLKYISSDSSDG